MSVQPGTDPHTSTDNESEAVELVIQGRVRDLGGFVVRRILPAPHRRLVGPFIFFDHMGPTTLVSGQGFDVRPHPHVNLATVTYLFEGEILHRDSLGSLAPIRPGAVNLMVAGRGIAHSERSSDATRASGQRLHGIQLWLALPRANEEDPPTFQHYPADTIPRTRQAGVELSVIIGSAYGLTSPVALPMATLYVEALLEQGAELALPPHEERAAYVVEGEVLADGQRVGEGDMLVFRRGSAARLSAVSASRVMLVGGAPLDGERHIWWNFVSSSEQRIERAKRDWSEGRFPKVPGDELEFIPLPSG